MVRLLFFLAVGVIAWKMFTGHWPWQRRISARSRELAQARQLLSVGVQASRTDILAAHRRLIALVHPDRGGTSAQVHAADAARDMLLEELPFDPPV
ncbi:molecular chaperone DnaJ [Altererythrobacter xixiisoli]|uniref:Molecular chaperone DnaJ n=1 Tax=Croceibacterium xixiisoli TaxID=1476466 RepID=A0A6I4TW97_9SPHN|nr:J domain-containing protein [Croceibacterium xixiisoli]MXP00113.1 molecular chaperone DnaJ [Croceibacterium xixiisoli]